MAELHNRADKAGGHDDGKVHVRLRDGIDHGGVRQHRRIVDGDYSATFQRYLVLDGRSGRDQVELELALEAFLHDLQVEQAEESAPESKTQGSRGLRLIGERPAV